MNCINLKQKLNRTLYCKYKKCDIKISDCSNCKYKRFKNLSEYKYKSTEKTLRMKNKSNKLAKLERNRKSILTNDLEHCIICGNKKEHLHEIFFGSNRLNSIKYNLVIPLCFFCHNEMHNNVEWQEDWHKKGQSAFIANYPDLDFLDIFKRNYL